MQIIDELCTGCGACESECPNQAVSHKKKIYKVNPAKCTLCEGFHPSPMCVSLCPNQACVPV
jgi:ferredoxin